MSRQKELYHHGFGASPVGRFPLIPSVTDRLAAHGATGTPAWVLYRYHVQTGRILVHEGNARGRWIGCRLWPSGRTTQLPSEKSFQTPPYRDEIVILADYCPVMSAPPRQPKRPTIGLPKIFAVPGHADVTGCQPSSRCSSLMALQRSAHRLLWTDSVELPHAPDLANCDLVSLRE
jgi:hypothetical protein